MTSSGLTIVSDTLSPGMAAFPAKMDAAIAATVEFYSPRVEGYARSHAPWKDQTGNARNGLNAQTEHVPLTRHSIVLSHSVPYGIWLEVRFDGRNEIIIPTIKTQGAELMSTLRTVLAGLS